MGHIKLKPSKEIKIDFHPSELDNIEIPEESKKTASEYIKSKELSEDDLIIMLEDRVILGFDYVNQKSKYLIVELNPITIFYSNAVMSFGNLKAYKDLLLSQSKDVFKWNRQTKPINLTHSAIYFQLAINCIINMQTALESFANKSIPDNYPYLSNNGTKVTPTVNYKLTYVLPKIKGLTFETKSNNKHRKIILKLIALRNDIIHLTPETETNVSYKSMYRELLDFDYAKAILAVRTFLNFYEPGLIEECECGKDIYFHSSSPE